MEVPDVHSMAFVLLQYNWQHSEIRALLRHTRICCVHVSSRHCSANDAFVYSEDYNEPQALITLSLMWTSDAGLIATRRHIRFYVMHVNLF